MVSIKYSLWRVAVQGRLFFKVNVLCIHSQETTRKLITMAVQGCYGWLPVNNSVGPWQYSRANLSGLENNTLHLWTGLLCHQDRRIIRFLPANSRNILMAYRRRNKITPRLCVLFGFVKNSRVRFKRSESVSASLEFESCQTLSNFSLFPVLFSRFSYCFTLAFFNDSQSN